MTETNGGLQGAGISPRERLERIEHALDRIENKLDDKASRHDVEDLQKRMSDFQNMTNMTPAATELMKQFRDLQETVKRLAETAVTEGVLRKYRRWIWITVVPAILGAAYAVEQIIRSMKP